MAKRKFIQSGEVFLLQARYADGFYIKETDVLPKSYDTAKEAIEGDNDFIRSIRLDLKTLIGEDVTEECASAWLEDFDGTPDQPRNTIPDFVLESEAFERWCEDYYTEFGINNHREHSTYNAVGGSVVG
jgi:hypothetical protein